MTAQQSSPEPRQSTQTGSSEAPDYASRVLGLLGGGAAGDALGYVVEINDDAEIRERFGGPGLRSPDQVLSARGDADLPVSDDTQMTLYVLDGLLEWIEWANEGSMADPAACVWLACLRWYRTQAGDLPDGAPQAPLRWIDAVELLHAQRAPGRACISGLARPEMGLPGDPHNPESKGCGTVMRSAPYGMVPLLEDQMIVSLARQGAALTHGHTAAWTSAAAFALMISRLMSGQELRSAVTAAQDWLVGLGHDDGGTGAALATALRLAESTEVRGGGTGVPAEGGAAAGQGSAVGAPGSLPEDLGTGWVAEEALAIAVYAALVADGTGEDPRRACELALAIGVNHAGNSDSTAALAGQLLGARHGLRIFDDGVLPHWIRERAVVEEAARRWVAATS